MFPSSKIPVPGQESALTLPAWLDRRVLRSPEGELIMRSLKQAQPLSLNPTSAEVRVRTQNVKVVPPPVASPPTGDAELSSSPDPLRTPRPVLDPRESARFPDDTGDKGVLGPYKEDDFKDDESSNSSGEDQDSPDEQSLMGKGTGSLPYRSDFIEPYEACLTSRNIQDVQFVQNVGGGNTQELSTRDADAYKSVLWEIKKQNDAFQESWKRLEERLDRLESVLSSVYKRGEPTIEGEKEEDWDFTQGFVVKEAESLDLIVDLSSVDNPVVAKSFNSARGIVEPYLTTESDTLTLREWVSKRPTEPPKSSSEPHAEVKPKEIEPESQSLERNIKQSESENPAYQPSGAVHNPMRSLPAKRWASLQTQQTKEPRLFQLERTVRSAQLGEIQGNQRLYWRPKSLEAWENASRRPSRHSSIPVSGSKRCIDYLTESENVAKNERVGRRRFRSGATRDSVEQSKSSSNQRETARVLKKQMRKKEDGEEKGMKFKLPSWISIRKFKEKKPSLKNEEPYQEDYDVHLGEEATRKPLGPVKTKIRAQVSIDDDSSGGKGEKEHLNKEVKSSVEAKHDTSADVRIDFRSEDCIAAHSGKKEVQASSRDELIKETFVKEVKGDNVFWFQGSTQPSSIQKNPIYAQTQVTEKRNLNSEGNYLSHFYSENESGGRLVGPSNTPAKARVNRIAGARPTTPISNPVQWQAGHDSKRNCFGEDGEDNRRRKSLKSRLRVRETEQPLMDLRKNRYEVAGSSRNDSPENILQKRLDVSPLRNPNLANMSRSKQIVFKDSIQVDRIYHDTFNPKNGRSSKNDRSQKVVTNDLRSQTVHLATISDPNSFVKAEFNQGQMIVPKLAGKHLDGVFVEDEYNAAEKMTEDGRDVSVLNKFSTEKCCFGKNTNKSQEDTLFEDKGVLPPAETPVHNLRSLRRLSSHSLEDLILKGCESAVKVLNDKLNDEIATLGVTKEECLARPVKDGKFVDRLVRQLKAKRNEENGRRRSRPPTSDFCDTFRCTDRFQADGRRRKLIQPVRTEPSHRFHFRESDGVINQPLSQGPPHIQKERLDGTEDAHPLDDHFGESEGKMNQSNYQRLHRRQKERLDDTKDAFPLNDDSQKQKGRKGISHRHHQTDVLVGSTNIDTKERLRPKNKLEEISGIISRANQDGKMVETFMFNPLWAPSWYCRSNNTTDILSKLFPSVQADDSTVQVQSSLKVRGRDGRIFNVDSDSLEKLSVRLSNLEALDRSENKKALELSSHSKVNGKSNRICSEASPKSLKEAANETTAAGRDCPSDSSGNDYNELYTVFSEKIYFPTPEDDKTDNKSVHVETIRISYPLDRSHATEFAKNCKTDHPHRRDSCLHGGSRRLRRTKRLSDILNHNIKWDVTDSEQSYKEKPVHKDFRRRKKHRD